MSVVWNYFQTRIYQHQHQLTLELDWELDNISHWQKSQHRTSLCITYHMLQILVYNQHNARALSDQTVKWECMSVCHKRAYFVFQQKWIVNKKNINTLLTFENSWYNKRQSHKSHVQFSFLWLTFTFVKNRLVSYRNVPICTATQFG